MARKKKTAENRKPYHIEHHRELNRLISEYDKSYHQKDLFHQSAEMSIFNALNTGVTRHTLRYYQLDALYVLDALYAKSQAERFNMQQPGYKPNHLVTDLFETIDTDAHFKAPFIGYEMATGSGKTMLMGASIYLLNKKYGVKNFLIIAPSSLDIYQKTIRNFAVGGFDSIWAEDTPFTFNLITGDNYTETLMIDYARDANIFIFNIDKFGANAKNTEKAWESSVWKDEHGNTIGIRDYLKRQKLVIITDEAHHTQGQKSLSIIKKFHPEVVLEFTATAVESSRDEEKRSQQVVYRYDIRSFLMDGYGKLVRAVALADQSDGRRRQSEIADSEKLKLITLLLIHSVKKQAVLTDPKARGVKPVAFVKVKDDTPYAQKVYDYIKNDLYSDVANLEIILEKAAAQDLEITNLISHMLTNKYGNDKKQLLVDIRKICSTTIFYHGKSDQMTAKQFLDIRKNDVEIVVYMEKLDEGIDLPNIYTMVVINDTVSNFKTSVKQIIGRGVRLPKEKREFDEEKLDLLKTQSEKLHVVCDQGKNFEEVILAIQKEFGLTDKYLSIDKERTTITNRTKSDRLKERYIPRLRADFKAKDGVVLMDLVRNIDEVVTQFLENNCFAEPSDPNHIPRYLKYRPEMFFIEVDVFADRKIYFEQMRKLGANVFQPLTLTEKQTKEIYGIVQKNLFCLPETKQVYALFEEYINRLNQVALIYPRQDDADHQLALNFVVRSFAFFYRNHIEKNFYRLDFKPFKTEDAWNLSAAFTDYQLRLPEDQEKNKTLKKEKDLAKLLDLIKNQYHFYGYDHSIYDYVKFDAHNEKQLADFADAVLRKADPAEKPFWVRNNRQIYFEYGSHKYYPDFIMFYDGFFYVIETKGEVYSDTRKNLLLTELDNYPNCKGVLVFSDVTDALDETTTFDEFLKKAADSVKRFESKAKLEKKPSEQEKYIKYLPAYQAHQADKLFRKKQKTAVDGWLPVPERAGGYPKTCFAVQVKGRALLPKYNNNDWILMDSGVQPEGCPERLVLIRHDDIEDGYSGNLTIRRLEITAHKQKKKGLFEETVHTLYLHSLWGGDPLVLEKVDAESIDIIGAELKEAED